MKLQASIILLMMTAAANSAEVTSFYPTGSVKQVKQVTVRFSSDMVAIGDPKGKTDPFKVVCKAGKKVKTPYTTRWADNKNWVLDFTQELRAGVRCTFTKQAELKDLAGVLVQASDEYSFSTAGPAILSVAPTYGDIEPEQYFVLLTDGEINSKSLEKNAYFEVQGLPDKIGVHVVNDQDRESVLRAAVKNDWRWHSYEMLLRQKAKTPFAQIQEMENFTILAGTRRFPDGAKVILHWPKGILSKSGLANEVAQQFDFKVIVPFEAQFSCERTAAERPCNPILDMRVFFTQRLAIKYLKGAKMVSEDGKTWTPVELKQGDQNKNLQGIVSTTPKTGVGVKLISNFEDNQISTLTFKAPFPDSKKFKIILPNGIKDELGRALTNQNKYPLEVSTDEYSPLLKFPATFGIIELQSEPILPVSVRNIEKQMGGKQVVIEGKTLNLSDSSKAAEIIKWYNNVLKKDYNYEARNKPLIDENLGSKFEMPKPLGEHELELVGIPLKKPGFYVVEMASPRLGEVLTGQKPMYVATSALVTDMAVHFKLGRESSLVWVTQLSNAKSVGEAKVTIVDSSGKEIAKGITNKDGLFKLGPTNFPCASQRNDEYEGGGESCDVFVFAQKGEDLSFTSSAWSKGIESYRFNMPMEYFTAQWGPVVVHTILDRMVARPGDVIQMKHVLRDHREIGFGMVNDKRLPKRVLVVHEGSQRTYTLPFQYDKETGTAIGKFQIPKEATLGAYSIYLSNSDKKDQQETFDWSAQRAGQFIVSDFRLPLMKASLKIQGQPLVRPRTVKVDLSAQYLSGGPASGLKVKLRTSLQPGNFVPDVPGGRDYRFFSRPIKVGVFDSEVHESSSDSFMKVQELALNPDGGSLASLPALPSVTKVQQLVVEMEYMDPSGEVKTAASQVPLFPSEYVVGLRSDSWYAGPGKTKVMGVITNNLGRPQSGRPYTVTAFRTNYVTHRKRLVGGFYAYDSRSEVSSLGKVCEGTSDGLGRFECEPKGLPAGSISLEAKVADAKDRATFASVDVTVYEEGVDSWWVPSDSDRIDLLPEKNRYEPSEVAKIVVRSPYPVATALVTVEREGVLDSFVTEVHRDNPVIEIPLKGNYAPNVFVSALLLRGRVAEPKATGLLDLARPTMKMGLVELKVGEKGHELLLSVKADKNKYRTREKVKVLIQVKTASGAPLPAGAEVAVAAVDEALMRLKENSSWKILQAMMGQRALSVSTSSGQNQVVGKRHFGSKAKGPGGSGGVMAADPREFFEPVLLWSPKIKLNAQGEASVTVPLNDSITSFRIVAVATAGEGFFGDGKVTVEATKELIVYSGLAPLVREGDQITNTLTVRNTTAQVMKVNLDVQSKDLPTLPKLPEVELKASEAKTLAFSLTVPADLKEMTFRLHAKDSLSGAEDVALSKVSVAPAVPAHVLQATLFQLDKNQQIPVKQPEDALPGKGGVRVSARAALASGLTGVKAYLDDYSFSCLEQRISKAIVLEDHATLERVIEELPTYLDSKGLLKFFSVSMCGSAQLTRYVMNILNANGETIPAVTLDRLVSGLSSFVQGQYACRSWWDELVHDQYAGEAKILVMDTLSRYKAFSPTMLSLVQINPNLWKNETLAAWFQLLKREANIPNREALMKEADNILHTRVNFQSSLMNLQGTLDWEGAWHLLTSPDQEAMGVFALAIDESSWSDDVGKIARGVVARLRLGHWDTTMANAWGMTQFRRFSAKFEKEKISGETKVSAGELSEVFKWQAGEGGQKTLPWPSDSSKHEVPVKFTHAGTGRPWITLETLSASVLKAPLNMGYEISRKITPVSQKISDVWHVGDVANVELTIVAKVDQAWVVVRDPIPAGASHLGTGLDGASRLLDRLPKQKRGTQLVQDWPTEYEEKSQADFVSYAAYLPHGTYRVNYRVRLNSAGTFKLPPAHVEAMYSPETFGEVPDADWKVAQ